MPWCWSGKLLPGTMYSRSSPRNYKSARGRGQDDEGWLGSNCTLFNPAKDPYACLSLWRISTMAMKRSMKWRKKVIIYNNWPRLTPFKIQSHGLWPVSVINPGAIEKKNRQKPTDNASQTGNNGGFVAKEGPWTNHRALKCQHWQSIEGLGAARNELCPLWWENGDKSLQIQLIRLVKYVVLTFACDVIGCKRRPAFQWVHWRSVDPLGYLMGSHWLAVLFKSSERSRLSHFDIHLVRLLTPKYSIYSLEQRDLFTLLARVFRYTRSWSLLSPRISWRKERLSLGF